MGEAAQGVGLGLLLFLQAKLLYYVVPSLKRLIAIASEESPILSYLVSIERTVCFGRLQDIFQLEASALCRGLRSQTTGSVLRFRVYEWLSLDSNFNCWLRLPRHKKTPRYTLIAVGPIDIRSSPAAPKNLVSQVLTPWRKLTWSSEGLVLSCSILVPGVLSIDIVFRLFDHRPRGGEWFDLGCNGWWIYSLCRIQLQVLEGHTVDGCLVWVQRGVLLKQLAASKSEMSGHC